MTRRQRTVLECPRCRAWLDCKTHAERLRCCECGESFHPEAAKVPDAYDPTDPVGLSDYFGQ